MKTSFSRIASLAAAAALAAAAGFAQAAITVFTSQATFLAAVQAPGVDTFSDLSISSSIAGPMARSAGAYGYTANAPDGLFSVGTAGDPWLSTNTAADALTLGNFSVGVRGLGALFFGSDVDGAFKSGTLTAFATDAAGATASRTFTGGLSSFTGFVSTVALVSVVITAEQPLDTFLWPTLDNLTLASPVPEPSSALILLAGIGLMSLLRNRGRGGWA